MIKCIFAMILFSPDADKQNAEMEAAGMDGELYNDDEFKVQIRTWVLGLMGIAVVTGIDAFVSKFCFGQLGENITLNVR